LCQPRGQAQYGSIGPDGKSYTQLEYEYATSNKKPVIAFLHGDPGKIQAGKTDPENREKLSSFRELAKQKMCKFWTTPQDLGSVVSRSIVKLIRDKPGVGWLRADRMLTEGAAQEILRLRDQITDLQLELSRIGSTPPKGAEELAQGTETVALHFHIATGQGSSIEPFNFTWNELLAALGPTMLSPVSESYMKATIVETLRNRVWDTIKKHLLSTSIRNEDFQTVKVQLRALGLIVQSPGRDPNAAHWKLTPYGDAVVTQIVAIRSNKADQASLG
jgi:hypothetical protein